MKFPFLAFFRKLVKNTFYQGVYIFHQFVPSIRSLSQDPILISLSTQDSPFK